MAIRRLTGNALEAKNINGHGIKTTEKSGPVWVVCATEYWPATREPKHLLKGFIKDAHFLVTEVVRVELFEPLFALILGYLLT